MNDGAVLVLGSAGQLGHELLRAAWPPGLRVVGKSHGELDITDRAAVEQTVRSIGPVLVVNAAAYTAVDRAEAEPAAAFRVNRDGARYAAEAAHRLGCPILHVSTDYVFDGGKHGAYVEGDPVGPLGIYGRSKLEGEIAVRAAQPRHLILRTAWVFGAHGHNFVKTMLRLARERDVLRVVADQSGCPTPAAGLAAAIVRLAAAVRTRDDSWGTYHLAGAPPTTWHGFAEAIVAAAAPVTGRRPAVEPIATADFPTPARRPANSVLDGGLAARRFGVAPPSWQEGLARVLEEIFASEAKR